MLSPTYYRKSGVLLLTTLLILSASAKPIGPPQNEAEGLAVVKNWLPYYHSKMELIFEYDSNQADKSAPSPEQMHKAIDKAGPTISIIEAQIAYEDEPRTIGGYNPYKWKTWLGRYESNPGRFVFDIDKKKRWERSTKRHGSFKSDPSDYGLAFGDGDLVINPDLKTGSARNKTFAPDTTGSVLIGQAGDFVVKSLRIYKVLKEEPQQAPPPIVRPQAYYGNPSPTPVPDHSSLFFELAAVVTGIAVLKRLF